MNSSRHSWTVSQSFSLHAAINAVMGGICAAKSISFSGRRSLDRICRCQTYRMIKCTLMVKESTNEKSPRVPTV